MGEYGNLMLKYIRIEIDKIILVGCDWKGVIFVLFLIYMWMKINGWIFYEWVKYCGYELEIWNLKVEDLGRYVCFGMWNENKVKVMFVVEIIVIKGNDV